MANKGGEPRVGSRELLLQSPRRHAAETVADADAMALRILLLTLQDGQAMGDAFATERMQQLGGRVDAATAPDNRGA
jgi:hypothetical protein